MGSLVGINHIGVSVRDLGAAREFWTALGLAEVTGFGWGPGTAPADEALGLTGSAAEVAILAGATAYLELFAFSAPEPAARDEHAPGIAEVTMSVRHLGSACDSVRHLGHDVRTTADGRMLTHCPDGTPVVLVDGERTGLRGVVLRVPDPLRHPLLAVAPDLPVSLDAVAGGDGPVARPCDLGANHICFDVDGIAGVRGAFGDGVGWHHSITSSSGGIASVCYGTTVDGVLVELLENHCADATLSRQRLDLL